MFGIIPAHAGSTPPKPQHRQHHPDHPRSRGEHIRAYQAEGWQFGSSPLTRGARGRRWSPHQRRGIIPAHAGSTHRRVLRRRFSRDHPRSRGEHGHNEQPSHHRVGSSPLTRGAPIANKHGLLASGIIPAHAGSTASNLTSSTSSPDHPRSRGEHGSGMPAPCGMTGSSPLTRGALAGGTRGRRGAGIIPAHAGSTA